MQTNLKWQKEDQWLPDRLGVVKPKEEEEGRDYKGALDNFCDDGYTYYLNSEDGFLGGNLSKCTLKYFQSIICQLYLNQVVLKEKQRLLGFWPKQTINSWMILSFTETRKFLWYSLQTVSKMLYRNSKNNLSPCEQTIFVRDTFSCYNRDPKQQWLEQDRSLFLSISIIQAKAM